MSILHWHHLLPPINVTPCQCHVNLASFNFKKQLSYGHKPDSSASIKSHPLERNTSPSGIEGVLEQISHSRPFHSLNMEASLPKTYVSIASYTSQVEGCLSFSKGDKCILIHESSEGWWLVNIGGREGWTPGECWREEIVSLVVDDSVVNSIIHKL